MAQDRASYITEFLKDSGWGKGQRQAIKGDASFRRYERIVKENDDGGIDMAILMDAPPPKENVRPFVYVTEYLRSLGLSAPEIYAKDEAAGLLLLEDLKIDSYSLILSGAALLSNTQIIEQKLYEKAVNLLTFLHKAELPEHLPPYDNKVLLNEVMLFIDWYIAYKDLVLSPQKKQEFIAIWEELFPLIHRHKPVFVHRDFHADNLMWLTDRDDLERVGLLDYQDALAGSPAYDLASLLEDARRDVSPRVAQSMLEHFLESNPHLDPDEFIESYATLAAQRNLKIIGIFSRLAIRDHKPKYLELLPRVWRYVENDIHHPSLHKLRAWLDEVVTNRKDPPATPAVAIAKEQQPRH